MEREIGDCHVELVNNLVKPHIVEKSRDIEWFDKMSGLNISGLVHRLKDDQQNDAPTFEEFVALGKQYPEMTFMGYRVGTEREDERITITGFNHPQAMTVVVDHHLHPSETSHTHAWWNF
jgi:hypothetical protein